LDQYQSDVSKVGVVMGWRCLTPKRQKEKKAELAATEKAQKKQQAQQLKAQKRAQAKKDKERDAARRKFEAKRQQEICNQ
jgi:hypothetical protein